MYRMLLFLACFGWSFVVQSQQAAQSSLYMLNPFHWNPAYAGMDFSLSAIAGFRTQWVGLEGAPLTQYLNAHVPLEILHGGIGIKAENDQYGAERNSWVSLAYNYHLALGPGTLGVALGGGLAQRALDGQKLRTPEGFYLDNILDHRDAILPQGLAQGMTATFEAGLFYQTEFWETGFGIRHLTAPSIDLSTFQSPLERTYFFQLGFHAELSRMLSLRPAVFVRSNLIQTQTDAGFMLRYNETFSAGASFRGYNASSIDALVVVAGLKLSEHLQLGYAYDVSLSPLKQVNNGSHEILLAYALDKVFGAKKLPKLIFNPRNL
ncbi:MAG: PorP/SprF family type IX secretion system membrane protein [Haliscomenobacter sp.]|nr:PorP/SprF family type IX secretion system membrane protein [Haliscomenobacter sp.]